MDISIKVVTKEPKIWYDAPHCQVKLLWGDHKEFMITLDYWKIEVKSN